MERQLTGKIRNLAGKTSPGREKIRTLLEAHRPLLILMDELLEYTTKAAGVKVGDSNLASQVLAFMQELTEAASTLDKVVLVFSLPSSLLERYDESAERLFNQLQKIAGRTEKIYAPVRDEEVPSIVRRRLFSDVNEAEARRIIEEFVDFAEREKILPEGVEKSVYRENFMKSYPFQPEVIDILYRRWGSFPTFQRTRGVLRLLGLVIYSLRDSKNPYVRLADFDLANPEIRRELLSHVGPQFDSVISQDITSPESASKKVNNALGNAYYPFSFGEKVATTIFMYSFPEWAEPGATITEIKRSSAELSVTSSIIADAVEKLGESAFYLWKEKGRYFFKAQPNLNKVLLTKMESVSEIELKQEEKNLLSSHLKKEHFSIYIWPSTSGDIPDTSELKLVIMQDRSKCKEFLEKCGEKPRIHRNTLVFLCPSETEKTNFWNSLRKKIAWQRIEEDRALNLTPEQEKIAREKAKSSKEEASEKLRELYRLIQVPVKDGFKEISLGHPTFGVPINFDMEVYERLRDEGEIVEKLSPLIIREKFLKSNEYVETIKIFDSLLNTPGEIRITSKDVLVQSIREGVKQGLFGLGLKEDGGVKVRFYKEESSPELVEGEVILSEKLCKLQLPDEEFQKVLESIRKSPTMEIIEGIVSGVKDRLSPVQSEKLSEEIERAKERLGKPKVDRHTILELKLEVPAGRLSDIARIMNYLKSKFKRVDVKMELLAREGEITASEYEDKILEALRQAGIKFAEKPQ
ncbi:MAG: DUF499 domain-containing protein [Candidatus Hadarchaeales archaeon]